MKSLRISNCIRIQFDVDTSFGSIFVRAEKMLKETEYQKAVEFVGQRKNMDKYFDLIDFVFCELFPQYRYQCFAYYEGKERQLRFLIDKKKIMYYDNALCLALELAYANLQQKRMVSWGDFREEFMEIFKAA